MLDSILQFTEQGMFHWETNRLVRERALNLLCTAAEALKSDARVPCKYEIGLIDQFMS